MIERELPQNIEAEQAVLGAMMISKEAILAATEILKADDFYREEHSRFFRVMVELSEEDTAVDLVTVIERLKKENMLDEIGGVTFVTYIANCVFIASNIGYHAKIVKELSLLRSLIQAGTEIICASYWKCQKSN